MRKTITRNDVLSSLLWKLMERSGTQGISFIVSIILARLLQPKEYGLIAFVTIFINLATVFVQTGFNTALIQKKDAEDADFSTVFFSSISLAGILYAVIFYISPFIASFYGDASITKILRVLAIILFFGAVNSIQLAVISRNMQFKKLFYCSFSATILSGIIGILMAYMGFGVWSLVAQQILNQIFVTTIMCVLVSWRPKALFSFRKLKSLLSYGWKILASNLISTIFLDLRSLIIGKMYNASMLAYFDRGRQFPAVVITNINGSIQSVMLPTYAAEQGNVERVKDMLRRSVTMGSIIVFPMMMGLAAVSEPLVRLLLTDKWLPSVPFLRIFSICYMFMPIHTSNLQVIQALGHSGTLLKLEIIRKILESLTLLIIIQYGAYAIAWGTVITSIISLFINAYPNKKILDYSYIEQLKDVLIPFLMSFVMGIATYSIQFAKMPLLPTLLIQICFGAIVYITLAYIFKVEGFVYLINIVKGVFIKSKGKQIK